MGGSILQRLASLASVLMLFLATLAQAAAPVPMKLWRLDCGVLRVDDLNEYSDTYAYVGRSGRFTVSCYLIQHGDSYMLWDTGLPDADLGLPLQGPGSTGESLSQSLPDRLASIGVDAGKIDIIGISHYHFDHTGQANHFPQARLLMGRGDVRVLRTPGSVDAKPLAHWFGGGGKVEEAPSWDKDVFGDQSVIMLSLPGHTPGHNGLLVKLPRMGYVLLSGDLAHLRENYLNNGVPASNYDRAQSLASLDRFKQIAKNLHATVVIQHEEADIDKLPRFPAFAQ
jgi:glyoxylase-like metal-dependent hydrolase (beta-lactamase superfamily II)